MHGKAPNDVRERRDAAAPDARIVTELNGCLLSPPRKFWATHSFRGGWIDYTAWLVIMIKLWVQSDAKWLNNAVSRDQFRKELGGANSSRKQLPVLQVPVEQVKVVFVCVNRYLYCGMRCVRIHNVAPRAVMPMLCNVRPTRSNTHEFRNTFAGNCS